LPLQYTETTLLLLARRPGLALTRRVKDQNRSVNHPFKALGTHLKQVREQRNETLAEASGAVEIDPSALERIEDGRDRPSEDILMLLINHFEVKDQEAVHLWESAGYQDGDTNQRLPEQLEKAAVVLLTLDNRTVYSDGLVIDANQSGLTLSFTQAPNHQAQPNTVAKVGMSYEQAEQVLASLQTAILYGRHAAPRRLPPASN
jgi:transcriptional regulator with XRE-family HTH domain